MRLAQTVVIAIATLSLGFVAACGDDDAGTTSSATDTVFSDAGIFDTTQPQPDSITPAVRKLEFEQAFGDDQAPCRNTARCTIFVSYTEVRSLKVLYTEDGVPTAGQVVKYALENDNDGVGFVNSLSGVTDAMGITAVDAKAKIPQIGQFTVKAWIDNSNLPELFFDVVVTPKGQVPLTVVATYGGTRPVGSYGVRLYRQTAGAPDCADPTDLFNNQTANQLRDNVLLTQSAKFPEFDNLENDGTQTYTILAYSLNANGAIQAWACNDTNGVLVWGQSVTVQLELEDRPPSYVGAYNIRTLFDLISAIPEPYRTWVDYVVGFFQDPTGTILELACDLLTGEDEELSGFCGAMFNSSGDLTPVGGFVADLLNAIITSLAQGSVFGTIFQVGGDVADILKAFEFKATLTFNEEPDPVTGVFNSSSTNELWHTVVVKWTLGQNCNPVSDEGCGVMQFGTNAFQSQAITGSFEASVADTWNLTIEQHPLSLSYGALISYALETFLIPLVVGDPLVNSYEELIGYLVTGSSECLLASVDEQNCCERFGAEIANSPNSNAEGVITTACESISSLAPAFLRGTLQGLDVDSGNAFQIGTLLPCVLADPDDDLVIEQIGTAANKCKWNVQIGNTSEFFEAEFWGTRAE